MLLTSIELPQYLPVARQMSTNDITVFLARANAYCLGVIGGIPPALSWDPGQDNLKHVVAAALELLAEGETAQIDASNGNITVVAPTRPGVAANPLDIVDQMLQPYRTAYLATIATN